MVGTERKAVLDMVMKQNHVVWSPVKVFTWDKQMKEMNSSFCLGISGG